MVATRNMEEIVYSAVRSGELSIDDGGRVFRGTKAIDRELSNGYRQVRVTINRRDVYCLAHRLVWRHFFGSIPNGMTINHLNGIRADNRPDNLELATPQQQQRHSIDVLGNVLGQRGAAHHEARLSARDVQTIRRRCAAGERQGDVAAAYRVSQQHVSRIVRRARWSE